MNCGVKRMFTENRIEPQFKWDDIGDITEGRPNLGDMTLVAVYRLMQFTLRDVITREYGAEKAYHIFYQGGHLAGTEFCKNILDVSMNFNEFIADLQKKLKELSIGVLKIEDSDLSNMKFTLTVAEDLDCSGLPVSNETVCDYDEGFIAGIFEAYTKQEFEVKEIDCWASGGRVCRFQANAKNK